MSKGKPGAVEVETDDLEVKKATAAETKPVKSIADLAAAAKVDKEAADAKKEIGKTAADNAAEASEGSGKNAAMSAGMAMGAAMLMAVCPMLAAVMIFGAVVKGAQAAKGVGEGIYELKEGYDKKKEVDEAAKAEKAKIGAPVPSASAVDLVAGVTTGQTTPSPSSPTVGSTSQAKPGAAAGLVVTGQGASKAASEAQGQSTAVSTVLAAAAEQKSA